MFNIYILEAERLDTKNNGLTIRISFKPRSCCFGGAMLVLRGVLFNKQKCSKILPEDSPNLLPMRCFVLWVGSPEKQAGPFSQSFTSHSCMALATRDMSLDLEVNTCHSKIMAHCTYKKNIYHISLGCMNLNC